MKLARSVSATWTLPASTAGIDSAQILAQAKALALSGPALVAEPAPPTGQTPASYAAVVEPQVAAALGTPTLDATYTLPYVAHVTMEVLNCTVNITFSGAAAQKCEIWAPTQSSATVANAREGAHRTPADADRRAHDAAGRRTRAQVRDGLREPGHPGRAGGEEAGEAHVAARGRHGQRPVPAVRGRQREGDARQRQADPGVVVSQRVAVDPRPARLARRRARSIRRRSKGRCTCRTRSGRRSSSGCRCPWASPWASGARSGRRSTRSPSRCMLDELAMAAGVDPFTFRYNHLDRRRGARP